MDDIDRIEVIRGPGGTIWGPNAVNGVINIITKTTKDTHGVLVTMGGGNDMQGIGTASKIEGGSPQHQTAIQSSFEISKRLELDLGYRYVSALSSQSVPGYSSEDARLAWHLTPQLEVSMMGTNLLQPWHYEYRGDPGPLVGIKRSAYLKLAWTK